MDISQKDKFPLLTPPPFSGFLLGLGPLAAPGGRRGRRGGRGRCGRRGLCASAGAAGAGEAGADGHLHHFRSVGVRRSRGASTSHGRLLAHGLLPLGGKKMRAGKMGCFDVDWAAKC